jgi:hypothetical protein
MSRSPRNRPRSRLTDEQAEIVADAEKGLSKDFLDNAFWLPHDVDEELIAAIRAFERHRGRLIELLLRRGRTADLFHRDFYFYLADLLDPHELKRERGNPAL